MMELRLQVGQNITLSVRKVILANHNSAEYKKLLIRSDFRGARCTAWPEPTNITQRKGDRKHNFSLDLRQGKKQAGEQKAEQRRADLC